MTRKIIEISGADRASFLQGLVTNDVTRSGLIYAALLTPQGKFIADFFLCDTGAAFLLDVDADASDDLIRRLTMYKLRADVAIAPSKLVASRGTGAAPEGALADPRHPALGWRLYSDETVADDCDYQALRVAHVIPKAGVELTADTYILEVGFERLNGVDFRKGCYVGQEIVARMKHKTTLRKGLVQVAVTGTAPVGTEITKDGKSVGTLFSQSGGLGLAFLRFERAVGEMLAGDAMVRRVQVEPLA